MNADLRHSGPTDAIPGLVPEWLVKQLDRSRRGGALQGIYLIDNGAQRLVLKVFGPKSGPLRRQLARIDRAITGRSAPDPETRYRTEKKALAIWRRNGFDVFREIDGVAGIDIPAPHLVLEHVEGRTLKNLFRDEAVPPESKRELLERFVPQWGRRHLAARQQDNRYLVQEHASFKHVLAAADGRLITFDFEDVFTGRHPLPFLIGREIAGYLRSLYRVSTPEAFEDHLDLILRRYPFGEFLSYPYRYFFRHPNRLLRSLYAGLRLMPRNRRANSRYAVIRRLQDRLGRRS
jgi:hypothetical protein